MTSMIISVRITDICDDIHDNQCQNNKDVCDDIHDNLSQNNTDICDDIHDNQSQNNTEICDDIHDNQCQNNKDVCGDIHDTQCPVWQPGEEGKRTDPQVDCCTVFHWGQLERQRALTLCNNTKQYDTSTQSSMTQWHKVAWCNS